MPIASGLLHIFCPHVLVGYRQDVPLPPADNRILGGVNDRRVRRSLSKTTALHSRGVMAPLASHHRGPWQQPDHRIVGITFVLRAVGRHRSAEEVTGLFEREVGVLHQPHCQSGGRFVVIQSGACRMGRRNRSVAVRHDDPVLCKGRYERIIGLIRRCRRREEQRGGGKQDRVDCQPLPRIYVRTGYGSP